MSLEDKYKMMWEAAVPAIASGAVDVDHFLNGGNDRRFGVTLLARPGEDVANKTEPFRRELQRLEPKQYHYPVSDLHFTVMSIISCREGIRLSDLNLEGYIEIIGGALSGMMSLNIDCRGVSAFRGGVLLQGFPRGNAVDLIRDNIRSRFQNSTCLHSIDSRYRIDICHSTLMRFARRPSEPSKLLSLLSGNRLTEWGTSHISSLELVFSDWYQQKKNTSILHTFYLPDY